jgi:hypothetical protein
MAQAGTSQCFDKIDHCINIVFEYPVISPCRKIVIFYKVTVTKNVTFCDSIDMPHLIAKT